LTGEFYRGPGLGTSTRLLVRKALRRGGRQGDRAGRRLRSGQGARQGLGSAGSAPVSRGGGGEGSENERSGAAQDDEVGEGKGTHTAGEGRGGPGGASVWGGSGQRRARRRGARESCRRKSRGSRTRKATGDGTSGDSLDAEFLRGEENGKWSGRGWDRGSDGGAAGHSVQPGQLKGVLAEGDSWTNNRFCGGHIYAVAPPGPEASLRGQPLDA
jgi:hypothetical protein